MGSGGGDPHRVLGVKHDASEAEIRRAYRALAKRHHPDGGQGSVARFLEIQAAYETLVGDGRPGAPDGPGGWGGTARRSGAAWPRWRRSTGTRSSRPGTATGGNPRDDPRPGVDPARPWPTTGRRRATLGSTSYDDAEAVFEPGWGGASWYGPSSGTYWTVNPREYADPRKHGPEYQARARRPAADEPATGTAGVEPPEPATGPAGVGQRPRPAAEVWAPARGGVAARILAWLRRGTIRP
jgi:hypothetical protein